MIEAVVFDLDGVLVDSEQVWAQAKRDLVERTGGAWREEATEKMLGMSSPEWSLYLHDDLGVALDPEQISVRVADRMVELYREELPLLPGAVEAVRRLTARWPLALATSSNREVIDAFLELTALADAFSVTVSSEEVERGKPSPDVYLEAIGRLDAQPERCAAIEDSSNGLRAASAAGVAVIALPNPHFPPEADALALADATLASLEALTPEVVAGLRP
jgi:HAD superfamily hydrolase (TIGR01509 family)